jgi:hypothetical protein
MRGGPYKTDILALLAVLRDLREIVSHKPLMAPKIASRKKGEGAFRKKAAAAKRDDKSDTEPFVNLANSLMRK